jgi:hypothetical protein
MGIFGEMRKTFHLERPNFALNPETDWICYYGRSDIEADLESIIIKNLRASISPKIVIWGDWGLGKTHTLFHFIHTLLNNYSTPIFVECPEFPSKSSFLDFYSLLMSKFGKERLVSTIRRVAAMRGNFDIVRDEEFKHLCQNVLAIATGDTLNAAWNWVAGLYVKEPQKFGVNSNQISVTTATDILEAIGSFYLLVEGKPLVFCVDEAHRLKNVQEDSDYERTFVQALRHITLKNFPVGFIYAIGAEEEKKIPRMFVFAEVKGRIGFYFVQLSQLDDESMNSLIRGIIRYARDGWDYDNDQFKEPKEEVKNAITALKKQKYNVNLDTYPFTEEAITQIIVYFSAQDMMNKRTPREICDVLNECGTEEEALKVGVIDENVVSKVAADRSKRPPPSVEG